MALSRLFGKSKKDPPSPSGSHTSPETSEREGEEGFTILGETKPTTSTAPANDLPPPYLSVSQLPYPVREGAGPALGSASSGSGGSHPLDGVMFQLSPRLTTDSELDQMSLAVEAVMTRIRSLEWAAFDYNFSLEQGVLSSDLNLDGVRIDS